MILPFFPLVRLRGVFLTNKHKTTSSCSNEFQNGGGKVLGITVTIPVREQRERL